MLIGVLSDTHDRVPAVAKAVELFNERKVAAVLHCGDFVSPFSLVPYKRLASPLYAVFGNNDGEKRGLRKMFAENGWTLNERPCALEIDGKRIAILHEPAPLDKFLKEGGFDLVVYGHTHARHFEKRGETLILNPGECCGWVKGTCTAALVDLASGECVIEELEL